MYLCFGKNKTSLSLDIYFYYLFLYSVCFDTIVAYKYIKEWWNSDKNQINSICIKNHDWVKDYRTMYITA